MSDQQGQEAEVREGPRSRRRTGTSATPMRSPILLAIVALAALTLLASCGKRETTGTAGLSPSPRATPSRDPALCAWAVGDLCDGRGVVYATSDGGLTWVEQPVDAKASLTGFGPVAFGDLDRGWVVGGEDDDILLSTTDGGMSWRPQDSSGIDRERELWDMACADAKRVWAVGDGIFLSSDGGASWSRQGPEGRGIACRDARRAWVVQEGGSVLATTDSGATWKAAYRPPSNRTALWSVACDESGGVWAVGECGGTRPRPCVLISRDGGTTWKRRVFAALGGLNGVALSGRGPVWAVGLNDRVWSSGDGGRHWRIQKLGKNEPPSVEVNLHAIAFSDALHGWTVGGRYDFDSEKSEMVIYGTTDGGRTWARQTLVEGGSGSSISSFMDIACAPM